MGFFSSITKPFKKAFDWVGDNVGDALGFVGDIAGGLMGMSSSSKATSANSAYNDANLALAQASLAFQQQYAKERLQWAKEDAQKAGFHPMVAAGLSPTSFSPVQASFTPAVAQDFDWVGKAGQNLSYAATKAKTNKQQAEMWNYTIGSAQQQLKSLQLDNTLKELEIASMAARLKQQVGGPAAPDLNGKNPISLIGGQDDSVKYVPDEVIASGPNSSVTAGTHPLWTHARTGDFVMPVLSGNLADAVTENKEKNVAAEVSYALSAWNGSLKPPINAFTAKEKKLLKSGEYSAYYYPFMGWRVEPTLSWNNFKKFVLGGFKK